VSEVNLSVLQNFDGTLHEEPYPYLTISDALPEDLYRELEAAYPSVEQLAGQGYPSNVRRQISAKQGLRDPRVADIWKQFMSYHTSQQFYDEVIDIFGAWCPDYEGRQACVRNDGRDMQLDCQPGINTPVTSPSSVKGPHVDNRAELYAGLLYMRKDDDDSVGGDFNVLKPYEPFHPVHKQEYDPGLFEVVDTVSYRRNQLVMCLMSAKSFHSVTPRQVTQHERRLVNVIAEVPTGEVW